MPDIDMPRTQSKKYIAPCYGSGQQLVYNCIFAGLLLAMISLAFDGARASAVSQSGRALYESNCAVCHGADGAGAMPGVKNLMANPAWMNRSDAELMSTIINGVQNPDSPLAMPPRAGNPSLTESQIRSIVKYLRQLADGH